MSAFRTAASLAILALPILAAGPSRAMTVADLAPPARDPVAVETAAFALGDALIPGQPSRLDRLDAEAAGAAAEAYFDGDAAITLIALAAAGGLVAAFSARSRKRPAPEPRRDAWREAAFAAVEADLDRYVKLQRAA